MRLVGCRASHNCLTRALYPALVGSAAPLHRLIYEKILLIDQLNQILENFGFSKFITILYQRRK